MEQILDTIFKRRSIRKYKDGSQAGKLLENYCCRQPWRRHPPTTDSRGNSLRSMIKPGHGYNSGTKMKYGNYNAPAAIMVLANLKLAQSHHPSEFWVQDCTAAVENILIAAAGMGLGTVWIGSFPKEDVMKDEREILGIPEDVIPLALIYVGYPAEDQPPRTQYQDTRVHGKSIRIPVQNSKKVLYYLYRAIIYHRLYKIRRKNETISS